MQRLFRMVQRRVPERHNRVAHVFVDRAAVLQNDFTEGPQKLIDKMRQLDFEGSWDMVVKFRTSQNINVSSRSSPPNFKLLGLATISSTTAGAR